MPHRSVQPFTRELARSQRREPSLAEVMLWRELRSRRFGALKWRRQVPLGPYVVDFLCPEARLIVELDGPSHESEEARAHDARRGAWLRAEGFAILRFPNELFTGGSGGLALERIEAVLEEPTR